MPRLALCRWLALPRRSLGAPVSKGDWLAGIAASDDGILRQTLTQHCHEVDDLRASFRRFRVRLLQAALVDHILVVLLLALRERSQRVRLLIFELRQIEPGLLQIVDGLGKPGELGRRYLDRKSVV